MEVRKARVGDVEFEFSDVVDFIGKVSTRGGSYYILVPKDRAESAELRKGDVVVAFIVKIKNIRLIPRDEVRK